MNEIDTTKGRIRQCVAQAIFDVRKPKDHPDHCPVEKLLAITKGVQSISDSMLAEFKIRSQMKAAGEAVVDMGKMCIGDADPAVLDGTVKRV